MHLLLPHLEQDVVEGVWGSWVEVVRHEDEPPSSDVT